MGNACEEGVGDMLDWLACLANGIMAAATVMVMDDHREVQGGATNQGWGASRTLASFLLLIGLSSDHISLHGLLRSGMANLRVSFAGDRVSIGLFGKGAGIVDAWKWVRGQVKEFSSGAARRLMGWLRLEDVGYRNFATLTIPHVETDGQEFKQRLDRFLKSMLGRGRRNIGHKASITWFLEFQERGSPHVHLIYNFYVPWEWGAARWVDVWANRVPDGSADGLAEFEAACSRFEAIRGSMISYAAKYASKSEQKQVPGGYEKVGRFWGIRGSRDRVSRVTIEFMGSTGRKTGRPDVIGLIWSTFWSELREKLPEAKAFKWKEGYGYTAFLNGDWVQRERFKAAFLERWSDWGEVFVRGGRKEHANCVHQPTESGGTSGLDGKEGRAGSVLRLARRRGAAEDQGEGRGMHRT